MNTKIRLLRKPLWTILWQIVLIASALLFGVGGALAHSSMQVEATLEEQFTTIAVQRQRTEQVDSTTWTTYPVALFESDIEMLEQMETVELVDLRTLTGAYIPELTPKLGLRSRGNLYAENVDTLSTWGANNAYSRVVLVGTVEQAWISGSDGDYDYDLSQMGGPEHGSLRYMSALLTIDTLLSGHPDSVYFPDSRYSEYTGQVIVNLPVVWQGEENFFQVGETYLLQGQYDPACFLTALDSPDGLPSSPHISYAEACPSSFRLEDSLVSCNSFEVDWESEPGTEKIVNTDGQTVPVASKLSMPVEAYLSAHDDWARLVEKNEAVLHGFPVLGTEALESMYVFVAHEASLVEGRSFTPKEYENGERVCVLSESVAAAAGVHVGDVLSFSQFLCGNSFAEGNDSLDVGTDGFLNNPSIGVRTLEHGFATEDEPFTVVGIYRLENEWENSEFSISPNTVFIPRKAQLEGGFGGPSETVEEIRTYMVQKGGEGEWEQVTGSVSQTVDNGVMGVYCSVVLKNGRMEEFLEEISETSLSDRIFLTFDQGYEEASQSIRAVIRSAMRLFCLTAAGWLLLVLMYILLNQSREKRNLGVMRSVGAGRRKVRRYLFFSGFLPTLTGIGIGTALSGAVGKLVQEKLIGMTLVEAQTNVHSGGVSLDVGQLMDSLNQSEIHGWGLLLLAAVQLAIMALLLWLHAARLAKKQPRKLLGV